MKNLLKIKNWKLVLDHDRGLKIAARAFLAISLTLSLVLPSLLYIIIPNEARAATTISKSLSRPVNELGLVGWWTFDGPDMLTNVADKSGQGDNGNLLHNASGTTTAPGRVGQALTFDGIDDYVTLGASFNGVQSVAFWVRVSTSTTLQKILDLNGTATVTIDSGTLNGNNFTGPTRYVDGVAASTINDTSWHYVVITTGTALNASAMDIGRISTAYLGGSLDDVRIYNRALSASEVERLYQIGATSKIAKSLPGRDSLTSGLVGWWTFDGPDMLTNVADRSGQGNTGKLILGASGNTATTSAPGKLGQALSFDGTDDYIESSIASGLPVASFSLPYSVSLWVKGNPQALANAGVYAEGSSAGNNPIFRLQGGSIGDTTFSVQLRNDAATNLINVKSTTNVWNNLWHHVVFTDNAGSAKLYIDGVQDASNFSYTPSGTLTINRVCIAAVCRTSTGAYFNGSIDDVRVYSRALSAAEVLRLYQIGATSKIAKTLPGRDSLTSGLVGWWTFDGPDMLTNVADRSGQNDTGLLSHGGSGTTTAPGRVGQSLSFDGVNDYVTMGASFNGVQSVAFWIKAATSTTLQQVIDLNGTATVTIDSGTLNGSNFTSPTRYVDGVAASTINDTNWHYAVITTGTAINASAMNIGLISSTKYLGGSLDDVRVYNRALSAAEVLRLYNLGR